MSVNIDELGTVDWIVVKFQGSKFTGGIAPILKDYVDRDLIRILDLLFLRKDDAGNLEAFEIADLDDSEIGELRSYEAELAMLLSGSTSWRGHRPSTRRSWVEEDRLRARRCSHPPSRAITTPPPIPFARSLSMGSSLVPYVEGPRRGLKGGRTPSLSCTNMAEVQGAVAFASSRRRGSQAIWCWVPPDRGDRCSAWCSRPLATHAAPQLVKFPLRARSASIRTISCVPESTTSLSGAKSSLRSRPA